MNTTANFHDLAVDELRKPHPDLYASQWRQDLRALVLLVYSVALEDEEREYQAKRAASAAAGHSRRRTRRG